MNINKDKLPIIYDTMAKNDVDTWIILGRETAMNTEPVLPVLGEMAFIIETALIFTKEKKLTALVSSTDIEGYRRLDGIDEAIEYTTLAASLEEYLGKLSYEPKRIALNFSRNDPSADGLSHGMFLMVQEVFEHVGYKGEIVSSYPILSKVRQIKTPEQKVKIKRAGDEALKIFIEAKDMIKKGVTSTDIFNFFHKTAFDRGYGMSWEESQCPGVFVGPDSPRGHMTPVEIEVEKGLLINVDYGVKIDGYVSDLQRMYYILKDDETDAPEDIKKAFAVCKEAIRRASRYLKPGVLGIDTDNVARSYIVENGYQSFDHALGHQVGHEAHDGGTILAPEKPRYNRDELIRTPVDAGNIFTLEPSFPTRAGIMAMEEMVIVTEDGCEFLVEPQEELWLLRI